jgi:hypothetical protein
MRLCDPTEVKAIDHLREVTHLFSAVRINLTVKPLRHDRLLRDVTPNRAKQSMSLTYVTTAGLTGEVATIGRQ